uniref:Anaphase-promoting complex subunit 4 WD40 domain-containing protein n=1 Tax=Emiliania huxleyi TaxID=2903 RepID=A0A7S3X0Z9_EMIHU
MPPPPRQARPLGGGARRASLPSLCRFSAASLSPLRASLPPLCRLSALLPPPLLHTLAAPPPCCTPPLLQVRALAFSPGGDLLASGGEDRAVLLWRLASGAAVRRLLLHTKSVWALSFSAEGAQLASAGADCVVGIWDVEAALNPGAAEGAQSENGPAAAEGEEPWLLRTWHTKFTPVVAAAYSRTNVLFCIGGFQPPEGYAAGGRASKAAGR